MKIRWGMAIRDSLLSLDQSNSEKGPLLLPDIAYFKAEFIKAVLNIYDKPGFIFDPNPFGSVFIFNQTGNNKGCFDFVDIPFPYWVVSIALPEDRILVVFLADRGIVKRLASQLKLLDYINQLVVRQ
jgi:hypothetical protein